MTQSAEHKLASDKFAQGWYIRELKVSIARFLRRNQNQGNLTPSLFAPLNTTDLEKAEADLHRDIDNTTNDFLESQFGKGVIQGVNVRIYDPSTKLYFEGKLVSVQPKYSITTPRGRWLKQLNGKRVHMPLAGIELWGDMDLLPFRKNGQGYVKTKLKEVQLVEHLQFTVL